jgi:competence protein ComGC
MNYKDLIIIVSVLLTCLCTVPAITAQNAVNSSIFASIGIISGAFTIYKVTKQRQQIN